ncbi:hypothetical protein ACIGB8_10480 [Promicromonospora sukumoe]|uniref:hypothetical protein n=1 Tax=Promicromonospora sukumoe TaxID=88382 RepID=UPI0037CB0296
MQDGRSRQAWVWVIAVLGYLILPVIAFFSILDGSLVNVMGGRSSGSMPPVGGVAVAGTFVIPVLTWVITLALHRERRAHGEKAFDGVVINWVGGILVAGLVGATLGSYAFPLVSDYLQTHERASVADDGSVASGELSPEPALFEGLRVAA